MIAMLCTFAGYSQCEYRTNSTDAFTGTVKKCVAYEPLVEETPDVLKKYMKNRVYFTASLSCAKINEMNAVYITVLVRSKDAYSAYGALYQDAEMLVLLQDSSVVTLEVGKTNSGDTDYTAKTTTYSTYFQLSDEQVKAITVSPVQSVRIYWSKGYTSYEVMNPDLFINQFKCLEQ